MKEFITDDQTIQDLAILEGAESILKIFDHCQTKGGLERIRHMLENPTQDIHLIKRRQQSIHFLQQHNIEYKVVNKQVEFISLYLALHKIPLLHTKLDARIHKTIYRIRPTQDFYNLNFGILCILRLLQSFEELIAKMEAYQLPEYLQSLLHEVKLFLDKEEVQHLIKQPFKEFLPYQILHYADVLFRGKYKDFIYYFLEVIFEIDSLKTIAKVASIKGFTLPKMTTSPLEFRLIDFFHPYLNEPIKNSLTINQSQNVVLLTGSNMAGKSTLLRSIGICVYLAHIGFPVPARQMSLQIMDGLMTTINLKDKIDKGLSHFAREVVRVKKVIDLLKDNKHFFVLFDELFRGTNVHDAREASKDIVLKFCALKKSYYIVSTHISELFDDLRTEQAISFMKMSVKVINREPRYSYLLEQGVCKEKIGYLMLQNRGVFEF